MKIINNITETLRDDLRVTIKKDSRVSIAAACFSMYAYQELKKQLEQVDEFRFIFTSPTFIKDDEEKQKKSFIFRNSAEKTVCMGPSLKSSSGTK